MNHESVAGDFGLGNFGLDELGIPGTNGGANFSSDPRYAGMPAFAQHGLLRPSATTTAGCRSNATSGPTRSPRT